MSGDIVPARRALAGEGTVPACMVWARLVNEGPCDDSVQRRGWRGDGGGGRLAACHRCLWKKKRCSTAVFHLSYVVFGKIRNYFVWLGAFFKMTFLSIHSKFNRNKSFFHFNLVYRWWLKCMQIIYTVDVKWMWSINLKQIESMLEVAKATKVEILPFKVYISWEMSFSVFIVVFISNLSWKW